jgi:hypothetical protein
MIHNITQQQQRQLTLRPAGRIVDFSRRD